MHRMVVYSFTCACVLPIHKIVPWLTDSSTHTTSYLTESRIMKLWNFIIWNAFLERLFESSLKSISSEKCTDRKVKMGWKCKKIWRVAMTAFTNSPLQIYWHKTGKCVYCHKNMSVFAFPYKYRLHAPSNFQYSVSKFLIGYHRKFVIFGLIWKLFLLTVSSTWLQRAISYLFLEEVGIHSWKGLTSET